MNTVMMTRNRPTVMFDVEDQEHRYWAHQFLKNRSWQGCPYLFALPQSEPNVYTMITRQLAEYYSNLEFAQITTLNRVSKGVVKMPQRSQVRG